MALDGFALGSIVKNTDRDAITMHDDTSLCDLIYEATVKAFNDWRKEHPNERVFAFALSTLDDATYVNSSLNSVESHQRRLKERGLETESGEGLDTKWGPWEWENEYTGQSNFAVVDDRLQQMYDQIAEDSFEEFRTMVIDSMLEALLKLKQHSIITNGGDTSGITMFATIYDSFGAEALHRRSAELLNSPNAVKEMLSVLGG